MTRADGLLGTTTTLARIGVASMRTGRCRDYAAGVGLVLSVMVSGCAAESSNSAISTTRVGSASCSSQTFQTQMSSQFTAEPGAIAVLGILTPRNKSEEIALNDGARTVVSEFELKPQTVIAGKVSSAQLPSVWVEGGTAGSTSVGTQPNVFTAADGRGIFIITTTYLPGYSMLIYGVPVERDTATFGMECISAKGLATRPAGDRTVLAAGSTGGALANWTASEKGAEGLQAVPLSTVETVIRDAAWNGQ